MNILFKILISTYIILTLGACTKYLDVIPEGQATLDDMFRSQTECEKFVQYLFHSVPTHGGVYLPDTFGADDFLTNVKGTSRWFRHKSILFDEENANNTFFGMWSTESNNPAGRTNWNVYNAIRNCYILLDRIEEVPDISDENLRHWRGMAYWLIAYYHQTLLDFYGPVVLVKGNISLNAPESEMYPQRSSYDECVSFIAENWDKAAELLPPMWPESRQGYATAAAARAYKARLYLTAASPLYNGNTDLEDFKNLDGTNLINTVYDANKWERARVAAKEAIEYAEANGYRLYTNPSTTSISEFEQGVKNYHDAFCETIWNRTEFFFSGASQTYPEAMQKGSAPRQRLPYSTDGFQNNFSPSFEAVEMYYTKNGLPVDVDPLTKNRDLYSVAPGDNTALLHRDREPRFYASVGFDRGEYDVQGTTITLLMRGGELHGSTLNANHEYQSPTGYLNKKFIHKELNYDPVTKAYTYKRHVYPYIRLAELYLSYAEADFEANGSLSSESLTYLNKVRTRCGLPNFETSWAMVGGIPSGSELRKILQQERSIEFFAEGRRYFDIRRWKIAEEVMNKQPKAWNLNGRTQADFYKLSLVPESRQRVFNYPKTNWLAIPLEQLNVNANLVQNPGYN